MISDPLRTYRFSLSVDLMGSNTQLFRSFGRYSYPFSIIGVMMTAVLHLHRSGSQTPRTRTHRSVNKATLLPSSSPLIVTGGNAGSHRSPNSLTLWSRSLLSCFMSSVLVDAMVMSVACLLALHVLLMPHHANGNDSKPSIGKRNILNMDTNKDEIHWMESDAHAMKDTFALLHDDFGFHFPFDRIPTSAAPAVSLKRLLERSTLCPSSFISLATLFSIVLMVLPTAVAEYPFPLLSLSYIFIGVITVSWIGVSFLLALGIQVSCNLSVALFFALRDFLHATQRKVSRRKPPVAGGSFNDTSLSSLLLPPLASIIHRHDRRLAEDALVTERDMSLVGFVAIMFILVQFCMGILLFPHSTLLCLMVVTTLHLQVSQQITSRWNKVFCGLLCESSECSQESECDGSGDHERACRFSRVREED